ncbi:hypothetical protein CMO94_03980 [Candidatus Woesearchaeota archaeon]|nr:hypothetical protein [Candidatus Woesearchaeota archaeon]|tara:strand:+ start:478 stop:1092 length:615 start_codon:yes stop_codon:yes gene_type:complete
MLRQEERATVSLRSFGSLIRVTGRKAKIEEAQIDSILNELKQGNFQRLAEFEKLVDDLLNNILENIKVYAQRDENKKIEMIYQFISNFFNHHLFDALDNKTMDEIKSAFDKDLKELIRKLRLEKRNERRLRRGRKPAYTLIKRTFYSKRSLDRQIRKGMEFFERCGYKYKHPKSIIKLYKHFGKNNFANMYSVAPWYLYNYPKE